MTILNLLVLPGPTAEAPFRCYIEDNAQWYEIVDWRPPTVTPLKFRQDVSQAIKQQMGFFDNNPAGVNIINSLKPLGSRLARFLPELLQEYLRAAIPANAAQPTPCLRIHTTIDWFPWELVMVDRQFLGVVFQIARLPVLPSPPTLQVATPPARPVQRICNLLGRNVLDSNDVAKWLTMFENLPVPGIQEFRQPSAIDTNDFPSLGVFDQLEPLGQLPDILHITCHGGLSDDDNAPVHWTLDESANNPHEYVINSDNVVFLMDELRLQERHPLIFGNACSSANDEGKLFEGFGSAFIRERASAFIGTFAPVSKRMAVHFACEFYQRLLVQGLPIAEALRSTKAHFAATDNLDPSWLFYCLFGAPDTRYELQ